MQSTMRATFCRLLFFVLTNSITEMECSVNRCVCVCVCERITALGNFRWKDSSLMRFTFVTRLEKLKTKRQYLVEEMTIVGQGLERSRNAKNKINSELLLDHLDRFLWPKIVDTSTAIFDNLAGDDELDHESRYQEELRRDVAKIRYKARSHDLSSIFIQKSLKDCFIYRARHCKSPDETFYRPWRRCLIFQGRKVANPCPANQQLYDGPDNFAICDCKKHVNYTMAYSDQTKQCYPLYTRVNQFISSWSNII